MKLLLPQRVIKRLKRKLRGRINEIGGVMVGEAFLADFFAKTGNDYKRFNYIGEWHSHPAFEPLPSGPDLATMYDIVEDPDVGINFAVLIIARLKSWSMLELSATLFRQGVVPEAVSVQIDNAPDMVIKQSTFERFLDYLT
jgi:hypothetical protein